jgi:hypothetical protein
MTRVRGEIEQLEGQHRYLSDRAALATLDVHISARGQQLLGEATEKFILMAHGVALRGMARRRRARGFLGTRCATC